MTSIRKLKKQIKKSKEEIKDKPKLTFEELKKKLGY